MDLNKYLQDEESQILERKTSLSDPKKLGHTICAFANSEGGVLLIGVDTTGHLIGITRTELDSKQRLMVELIKECRPIPSVKIKIHEIEKKSIIIVCVNKLFDTVCFFDGKVWIRTGSTNRQLNSGELIEFLKGKKILNFEDQVSDATIEDMDPEKLQSYLEKRSEIPDFRGKDTNDLLFNLKLLREKSPTNLAVLFFAKNLSKFIPYAEIRLIRFKGTEPVDIINTSRITKVITEAIDNAISFIRLNTKTKYEIKDIKREDIPDYPVAVIREAVSNAVGHRDYYNQNSIQISIFDDRIEITNPGRLPMELKLSDLGRLAVHRNPRLYQMLSLAGYAEGYGTGVPRMIQRMRESGLPDPFFEEIGSFFRVTLYNLESKKAVEKYGLNRLQQKIFTLVKNGKNKSKLIAKECQISVPTVIKHLAELEKKGIVEKTGTTRGAYYKIV